MKYLVLVLVLMGAIWWIRQKRVSQTQRPSAGANTPPQPMLACAHCGTHVPQHDMVQGRAGHYCSSAHRQAHEGHA